jgi:hypothetical protein
METYLKEVHAKYPAPRARRTFSENFFRNIPANNMVTMKTCTAEALLAWA